MRFPRLCSPRDGKQNKQAKKCAGGKSALGVRVEAVRKELRVLFPYQTQTKPIRLRVYFIEIGIFFTLRLSPESVLQLSLPANSKPRQSALAVASVKWKLKAPNRHCTGLNSKPCPVLCPGWKL